MGVHPERLADRGRPVLVVLAQGGDVGDRVHLVHHPGQADALPQARLGAEHQQPGVPGRLHQAVQVLGPAHQGGAHALLKRADPAGQVAVSAAEHHDVLGHGDTPSGSRSGVRARTATAVTAAATTNSPTISSTPGLPWGSTTDVMSTGPTMSWPV